MSKVLVKMESKLISLGILVALDAASCSNGAFNSFTGHLREVWGLKN